MEDTLGLRHPLGLAYHTLSGPTYAESWFSTKPSHMGRVVDFILTPVPQMLICATHRCFLMMMISPRDLCLHFGTLLHRGYDAHYGWQHKLSDPIDAVSYEISDPPLWVGEGYCAGMTNCLLALWYSPSLSWRYLST